MEIERRRTIAAFLTFLGMAIILPLYVIFGDPGSKNVSANHQPPPRRGTIVEKPILVSKSLGTVKVKISETDTVTAIFPLDLSFSIGEEVAFQSIYFVDGVVEKLSPLEVK